MFSDGASRQREVAAELRFEDAVEPLELLLLAEADAVLGCLPRRKPCMPGGGASRSIGHLGLSQRSPLRKSFICSRRHSLQTGSMLRAMAGVGLRSQGSVDPAAPGIRGERGRSPMVVAPGEPRVDSGTMHNNVEVRSPRRCR